MSLGAAQGEQLDAVNHLASEDDLQPMGSRKSGRIEERMSFVSGRGSWHPSSAPETNGAPSPAPLPSTRIAQKASWEG